MSWVLANVIILTINAPHVAITKEDSSGPSTA